MEQETAEELAGLEDEAELPLEELLKRQAGACLARCLCL